MRICVFGAGAVGSHFAVRLARAGHDVSCVMRGAHLDAVMARGLTLRVGDGEFKAAVKASSDPAALGPQDAVICTLKATGLPTFEDALQPLLDVDTAVVFAQNGIPWWYDIGLSPTHPPVPDLSFSTPAAVCARRSRRSASSAAWYSRPTKSLNQAWSRTCRPSATAS